MEENDHPWMDEDVKLLLSQNFNKEMGYPPENFEYYVRGEAAYALTQISQCVLGVISSLQPFLWKSLLFSILQRLVVQIDFHNNFSNLLIGLLGYCLLWLNSTSQYQPLSLTSYFLISTCLIFLLKRHLYTGHCCVLFTLLFTTFCQYYFEAAEFTSFRGSLMIASMKQISLAYDFNSMLIYPHFLGLFAFIFNPATLIFGPFITYQQFCNSQNNVRKMSFKESLLSVISTLKYLGLAILFVTYSSCLADELPYLLGSATLQKYTTAQAYRASHYFVCYFAMFTTYINGFDEAEITKVTKIESPSSMVDVVVFWNMPMHRFLHKYIFQKTRLNFGYAPAMFATFLASSLLHGFNFLLTAVLLSLGFYAYAENVFRNGLSKRLNSCVKSRECRSDCEHHYKRTGFWVISLNLVFVFLNIFHLAYLGSPFQQTDAQETGYSWHHTIGVWQQDWFFSSHLIAVFMFFSSFLL